MNSPVFAVVGEVNKGKSSVVATLAEDDTVLVTPDPGSTTECVSYPLEVDGQRLYTLIDTPGFQEAPRALAWMRAQESSAADRATVVRAFVDTFDGGPDFPEECKLLRPLLDGAAILYIVDGARPYDPTHEAEMEILRWTGCPRMALINRIGADDYSDAWRQALGQYFSIVRLYDAMRVVFRNRIELLQAFRELSEEWRAPLDTAVHALEQDWKHRHRAAARRIAALIAFGLTHNEEIALARDEKLSTRRAEIEERFHDSLRRRESRQREEVQQIYKHHNLKLSTDEELRRPIFDEDLFASNSWSLMGLGFKHLAIASVATGAAMGAAADLALAGLDFGLFTGIGGLAGLGTAGYYAGKKTASISALRRSFEGHKRYKVGPMASPNFPWILLDRAAIHALAVRDWAHARREPLILQEKHGSGGRAGLVSELSASDRLLLERLFIKIRRGGVEPSDDLLDTLAGEIDSKILQRR